MHHTLGVGQGLSATGLSATGLSATFCVRLSAYQNYYSASAIPAVGLWCRAGGSPPCPRFNRRAEPGGARGPYDDFRRHGADLDAPGKKRLEEIDVELTRLTTKFSKNVLDTTNAFDLLIANQAALAGLPAAALASARESAARKGREGWRNARGFSCRNSYPHRCRPSTP